MSYPRKVGLAALIALTVLGGCDPISTMHGGAPANAQSSSPPANSTQQARFSIDTPLGELARNAQARAIVDRYLPGMTSGPHGAMAAGYTLRQIQAQMPNALSQAQLEQINRDLAAIQ